MAKKIFLRKLYDSFVPVDQASMDAMEEMGMNAEYQVTLTKPRNIHFHKKLFALIGIAYDAFDLGEIKHKGTVIEKNRERFRKDLTIQAGFYDTVFNLDGELRLEAKSISFAKMDEEEFARLYDKFITVILQKVLTSYTAEDLDQQVNKILGFV